MKLNFKKYYLYFTVFIAGAVILMLEILGTRIIAPFYGATIYVWSSLIIITLMSLAVGYFLGGWLADKKPRRNMIYYILALATFFILFIPVISKVVLNLTNPLGASYGVLVSAFVLFTIPLVLLGMIAPYAIKLRAHGLGNIGFTSGKLYGIATIGSCFGALLTGFYLIPNIGISNIIFMMGFVLCATASIFFLSKKKFKKSILVLVPLLMIFLAQPAQAGIVYETESAYAKLKVVEDLNRYLLIDGATQVRFNLETKEFNFPYLRLFEEAVKVHPNPNEVLNIGLGGGGMDSILSDYNLNIDNIEIDEKVVDIARDYFNFTGNVIIDEGRHYIRNTDKQYDVIIMDVYMGHTIYPYILSFESFTEMKNVINEEGIVAINLVGYEGDELFNSLYSTLDEVFENVYVKTTNKGLANIIFIATDSELDLDKIDVDKGIIITDDYNPVEALAVKSIESWRGINVKKFGELI
jgi:spermidine synthase